MEVDPKLLEQLRFPSWVPEQGRFEMWLTAGFFDESTDEDTEGLTYAVAGFIGAQLITATLELRWRDLLTKYEIEYFKASELNSGMGQFKKFRDDPGAKEWRPFSQREKDLFKEIKTDFLDVILGFKDALFGIGAVVILPDLERLHSEYPHTKALPAPYFLCSQLVLVEAGYEMVGQNAGHPGRDHCFLRPIFDSHEQNSGRAKQAFDGFCEKNPESSRFLLPMHYESDKDYLALQAADDFAFEIRKMATAQQKQLPTRREPLKRYVRSGNILKVYKLDYEALKMIADGNIADNPSAIQKTIAPIEGPLSTLRDTQ